MAKRKRERAAKKKGRDYKAEYQRRMRAAKKKGISLSIARGHPKKGEVSIARARSLGMSPDLIVRPRWAQREGYRPTRREIIGRLQQLSLPISSGIIRSRFKGRMPNQWSHGELKPNGLRDRFVDDYVDFGLTEREAYTLWFSP